MRQQSLQNDHRRMTRPTSSQYHLIYIPGLGDGYDFLRRAGLFTWRIWGVSTELVPMRWYSGGDYAARYAAVITAINRAQEKGRRVVLVGESAGASLAINVAARRSDIGGLLTICGIASAQAEVSPLIRKRSPAFNQSLAQLGASLERLDKSMVCNVRPLVDSVVPKQSSVIAGARQRVLWGIGHLATITLSLSLYGGLIVHYARTIRKS